MNNLVLVEEPFIDDLLPFTATRCVIDIRVGILTLREKWQSLLSPIQIFPESSGTAVKLPANILPTRELADLIKKSFEKGSFDDDLLLALNSPVVRFRYPWDLFLLNDRAIREDFILVTDGRVSQAIPSSVRTIAAESIFIEEGARLEHCMLNARSGPIYIGRNTEIMEGTTIRGPFALCEGAVVKMGARIYGATTVGPHCIVGGEIKNSILFGYSNKAHDGYLGDSVIGEWCNLGAGCTNSNIKNSAGPVKVYHPATGRHMLAGLKCGLLMGDYSRASINTSFNTGTVCGVSVNLFGTGLTPKYVPDFNWGYPGRHKYEWEKAVRDIANWKKLKNHSITDTELLTLKNIFEKA